MTLCSSKAAVQSPPSSIGSGSRLLSEQMRTRSRTERARWMERPMDGAPDRRRRDDFCEQTPKKQVLNGWEMTRALRICASGTLTGHAAPGAVS